MNVCTNRSRGFTPYARRSLIKDLLSQTAIATASLAVMVFVGSCLLAARGSLVMPGADRPLVVTSIPTSPVAFAKTDTAPASDTLPDASTWARTPNLFGQSAPLRAGFQKPATQVAAAKPALNLAPAPPEDVIGPPVQVASLGPDAIPLPPIPDASNLVRDVPLPAPRPADLKSAAVDPKIGVPTRTPKDKAGDQPAVAPTAPGGVASLFDKIFGSSQQPSGPALAYANPNDGLGLPSARDTAPTPPSDRTTAIYDISAKTVFMPDGTRLEAHSGLREMLDDPRYVHVMLRGATPPAVYDLKLREKLFHGVQAIRLTPVNSTVHGRVGLLAHTYMLGPNGDSNGCVSFRNYDAFLQAFIRGHVTRLAVVSSR